KYGFTQVGTLGGAGPSMLVLLGRPEAPGEADANLPHLTHQPPLHPASPNDPNVPKTQATKLPPHDANLSVTPIFPPLRDTGGTSHHTVNAFGHSETVEVLPAGDPFVPRRTPTPPPLATEWIDRTPFDWRQFQIRQEGGSHDLV